MPVHVESDLPDYDDLPRRGGHPAAWDLWGPDDVFGCLNLLTPERAADAARLVERGAVFAMNWSMGLPDPPLFGRAAFRHEVTGSETSTSRDDVLHDWNTQSSSQWDGFRHVRNHGALADEDGTGNFGGVPDAQHGIDHWAKRGIVGRAVLADVARWRESVGRPLHYDRSDPIEPSDVVDTLVAQGTQVHEGDVLLIRTGWIGWYEQLPADERARIADVDTLVTPGLRSGEELARVLWNLHVSAVAADNPAVEVWPPGSTLDDDTRAAVRADRRRMHELFTHTLLLPMLGLPLGEMFVLDALAEDCAADGRYECFFTSAPLNLPHGVASPPNALAIK